MGLCKQYNCHWEIPAWPYAKYFKNIIPQGNDTGVKFKEPYYHYNPDLLKGKTGNIDLDGYFQAYGYWDELLEFTDDFKTQMQAKYQTNNTLAISIRRGDFVNNSCYWQLSITYYLSALIKYFPDWQTRNILIFSDDIDYCRMHFECMPNVRYAEGKDIEQLCGMTLCSDFIISNSTFSYCGAYLAQTGKVIRPVKNMDGPLAARNSEKDFWPPSWIIHDNEKLSIKDATFTIPVYNDHIDRKQNLELGVCMLQRDFDTNIIIGEQGKRDFEYMGKYCKYMHFDLKEFHRTKMLNDMCIEAETEIIFNWDADVFMAPMQVYLTVQKLRDGQDFVYPYDGRFARVPRVPWFKRLEKDLDIGVFVNQEFKGKNNAPLGSSVGGAVGYNKEAFIDSGMENEKMISYAPEDCERWDRWHLLGYKVERVAGPLYHLDHFIGANSGVHNPHFKANHELLKLYREMTKEQLRAEVDTWGWVNKYTENYYNRIEQGAIDSAKIIYEAIGFTSGSVIDIGCGKGEWNNGNPDYVGVDYKVMKRSLLFPVQNYYDYDLTCGKEFPVKRKFDLCLCLEVLEHIPEQFANAAVKLLCSLSDTVLFSAAIPGQGGVQHVNERWQSWWEEKFNDNGFQPVRYFRELQGLECWYAQNIVLYRKGMYCGQKVTDHIDKQMWLNIAKKAGTLKT